MALHKFFTNYEIRWNQTCSNMTRVGFTSRLSIRCSNTWAGSWSDGRYGSISACGGISATRRPGYGAARVGSPTCLRPGVSGRRRLDANRSADVFSLL